MSYQPPKIALNRITMISLTFQLHNIGAFSVNSVFNVVGSNFGGTISGWGKKEKKLNFSFLSERGEKGL